MLEGTLDTFSLPDIFQLLAFTKKSGCLHLQRGTAEGRVWFKDGQVFYAVASGGRLALGKRLVGAGVVTAEQVQEALEQQRDHRPAPRLGRILLEMGAIDEPTLETFVREQVQDAVFDLMQWADGQFVFESPADTDEPIGLAVTVENLIMEGSRRMEEWAAVRKKVPGSAAVVAMAPAPGDGNVEVNLRPEEWRLLSMVDGRRTVQDLVELSGQGEFTTCKLLYGLVGAGLLEIRDPAVHGPPSIAALLRQVELIRQLEAEEQPDVDVAEAAAAEVAALAEEPGPEPGVELDLGSDGEPHAEAHADAGAEEDEVELPIAGPVVEAIPDPVVEEPAPEPVAEAAPEPVAEAAPSDTPAEEEHQPGHATAGRAGRRLHTDPGLNAELIDRLIEGVKGL